MVVADLLLARGTVQFLWHEVPSQCQVRVSRPEAASYLMVYRSTHYLTHWLHSRMCRRSFVVVRVKRLALGRHRPGNVQ